MLMENNAERERDQNQKEKKDKPEQNENRSFEGDAHLNLKEVGSGTTRDMDHATSCAEKKRDDRRRGAGEKM
jgi:hypothetical protein